MRREASVRTAAALALVIGVTAAAVYWAQDLTLSHYDAKAHLVVARRITDSVRPGWLQIGAVWLPLPHLLNLVPIQVDWLYRTGWSAVLLSVAGFVLAATSLWWLVMRATESRPAAWAGFAVFSAQPDVLYLQATPMTETLLMGLCLLGVAQTWRWVAGDARGRAWPIGIVFALACLTRYEAWPITAASVGAGRHRAAPARPHAGTCSAPSRRLERLSVRRGHRVPLLEPRDGRSLARDWRVL